MSGLQRIRRSVEVWKKLRSMVVGARGVHAAEQAFAKEELKAAALSELDAVLPGCNRRVHQAGGLAHESRKHLPEFIVSR